MNYHEDELRKSLGSLFKSGEIREFGSSSAYFAQLSELFPASGSKINWCKVDRSVEDTESRESMRISKFIEFFNLMCTKFSLTGEIIYLGDSATEFALCMTLETLKNVLPELLVIPQHHYFLSVSNRWCMCFTMEGDMGFGFSKRNPDGMK